MHLARFLPIAFAASTTAAPSATTTTKRDLATIQNAFNSISSAVTSLDQSILRLTAQTPAQEAIATLTAQSQAVVDTINASTAAATPTSPLSLSEALTLLQSSQSLPNTVDKTITDLIGKQSIVQADNASALVVEQLNAQKTATQAFIAAVVSKVPAAARNLANTQAQQVVTALNRGITAYGG